MKGRAKGPWAAAIKRCCKRLPVLRLSSLLHRNKTARDAFIVCRCHFIQVPHAVDLLFYGLDQRLKVIPHGQKFK